MLARRFFAGSTSDRARTRHIATALACMVFAGAALASQEGCRRARNPQLAAKSLESSIPTEREDAAHDLRRENPLSPQSKSALLAAIAKEQDNRAYGEMLLALSQDGTPEAEPYICAKMYDADRRMRDIAKRSLKLWLPYNRQSQGCPPPGSAAAVAATPAPSAPGAAPSAPAGVTIAGAPTGAAPAASAPPAAAPPAATSDSFESGPPAPGVIRPGAGQQQWQ